MTARATLIWFRQDLRLADNPALHVALERRGPVIPVYLWAPEEEGVWNPGSASRWWLHQSLVALDARLRSKGSQLIIRRGKSLSVLHALIQELRAEAVVWNRCYEPVVMARDAEVKASLQEQGIRVESFNAGLLFEPWTVANKAGKPFRVFTPFWKTCLALSEPPAPLPQPDHIPGPERWPATSSIQELGLEPRIDWAAGIREAWSPGEQGAVDQLQRFLEEAVDAYAQGRDRPDFLGTSRLSPHLHFGEIGPRQVWRAIRKRGVRRRSAEAKQQTEAYLRQLGWREFAYHLLYHFPHTTAAPLRQEFAAFPWREDQQQLRAWQRGRTGYPFVDAGMRELWTTGWMHNRARMAAASFLVKHLLLSWQEGVRWFWDTLVDADLANNTLGWQWVAGCGADAAPYFRIFNPVAQGEKFDPHGHYVRRWIPELDRLPAEWIHKPWEAPSSVLKEAGVKLGRAYPLPIVGHTSARVRALDALNTIKAMRGNKIGERS
jgi:deoxyribodipyrimidine photo-lyase